ncbi:acyl carrier protein [Actinokineospora spheciospongiae]|uniref:acyl carrier protein n=1 Tax=Actinokineospora spheciospongiae TaxID=909613 RepID=UPI000D713F04|nr:acyl carrier protein [Actinokineospora spheciospongiae]PWW52664.1 acyl carrier protein [Actinokineospora spheciospongiae]
MRDKVREFVVAALAEMNYDVGDVTGDSELGPAGLDMESLGMAELAVRVEDEFGVAFDDEEAEGLALMTLDEYAAAVVARLPVAEASA